MAAVERSGAYSGATTFTGPEGGSKGKLVSNCTTLRALGWQPKYRASTAPPPPPPTPPLPHPTPPLPLHQISRPASAIGALEQNSSCGIARQTDQECIAPTELTDHK